MSSMRIKRFSISGDKEARWSDLFPWKREKLVFNTAVDVRLRRLERLRLTSTEDNRQRSRCARVFFVILQPLDHIVNGWNERERGEGGNKRVSLCATVWENKSLSSCMRSSDEKKERDRENEASLNSFLFHLSFSFSLFPFSCFLRLSYSSTHLLKRSSGRVKKYTFATESSVEPIAHDLSWKKTPTKARPHLHVFAVALVRERQPKSIRSSLDQRRSNIRWFTRRYPQRRSVAWINERRTQGSIRSRSFDDRKEHRFDLVASINTPSHWSSVDSDCLH